MTNYELINEEILTNDQFKKCKLRIGKLIRHSNLFIRNYFIILVSLFVISLIAGCAQTVTQLVAFGDQMAVEVTLKGKADVNANRYFLVVSSNPSYKVPLPPPDIISEAPELVEPGIIPAAGSPEAYYANFYSTWSGYVILDPGGYYLIKGPFVIGQTPTREVLSGLGEIGTKLNFSFRLERIFSTVPDQIYFDFISVAWPSGQAKIPSDHLPSTNNYISKTVGSIVTVVDGEDSGLDAGLDIVSCRVEIQ
jgi:hypothetical protein